ncbi:hypothetical protein [Dickeya phage Sucellus]|nr:hypothetical protein [Dickeya phage Sucellus]
MEVNMFELVQCVSIVAIVVMFAALLIAAVSEFIE